MNTATHTLIGGVIGAVAFKFTANPSLVVLGLLGGALPDLDMLMEGHRKKLHFPDEVNILGALSLLTYMSGFEFMILPAVFFFSAGLHSFMDIFAGAELRSWDRNEWRDKAVYDHLRKTWHRPRRWVVGGSVGDLMLSIIASSVLIYTYPETWAKGVTAFLVVISAGYTATVHYIGEVIPEEYDTLNDFVVAALRREK